MDLRCDNKLHAVLDGGFIDVACSSSFCGAKCGVTVIHRFDATTGEPVSTTKFKTPERRK